MTPMVKQSIILTKAQFKKLVAQCFKRDHNICQVCRQWFTAGELCPHHIIPRGRIRVDTLDNLLTVCVFCHVPRVHGAEQGISVDDLIQKYLHRVSKYLPKITPSCCMVEKGLTDLCDHTKIEGPLEEG